MILLKAQSLANSLSDFSIVRRRGTAIAIARRRSTVTRRGSAIAIRGSGGAIAVGLLGATELRGGDRGLIALHVVRRGSYDID